MVSKSLPCNGSPGKFRATWNGTVRADSDKTIVVEGNHYFPPDSIRREYFLPTDTHSTCPWKGQANYYSVKVGDTENTDAAKQITDHVAFWKGIEVR